LDTTKGRNGALADAPINGREGPQWGKTGNSVQTSATA